MQSEKGKVQQLEADSISACENLKELRAQNLLYLEKLQKNEEAILILDQQKGDLLLEL